MIIVKFGKVTRVPIRVPIDIVLKGREYEIFAVLLATAMYHIDKERRYFDSGIIPHSQHFERGTIVPTPPP